MAEKRNDTYIQFTPEGMKYGFYAYCVEEKGGNYSWYVPAYDIYFSSPSKEEGSRRAKLMVSSFFNFWVKQQGIKQFGLQLHKLGFRATNDHHTTLQQFLNNHIVKSKFKSPESKLPFDFEAAEQFEQEGEMAVA